MAPAQLDAAAPGVLQVAEPVLSLRLESPAAGLNITLMLPLETGFSAETPPVPKILAGLRAAGLLASGYDAKDEEELACFTSKLQKHEAQRQEAHAFYMEVSKQYTKMADTLQKMKKEYYLELDSLRNQLSLKRRDPNFSPEDVIFFDPTAYQLPKWQDIVGNLDDLRMKREVLKTQLGGDKIRTVPVHMLCQACRHKFQTPEEERKDWEERHRTLDTQTDLSGDVSQSRICEDIAIQTEWEWLRWWERWKASGGADEGTVRTSGPSKGGANSRARSTSGRSNSLGRRGAEDRSLSSSGGLLRTNDVGSLNDSTGISRRRCNRQASRDARQREHAEHLGEVLENATKREPRDLRRRAWSVWKRAKLTRKELAARRIARRLEAHRKHLLRYAFARLRGGTPTSRGSAAEVGNPRGAHPHGANLQRRRPSAAAGGSRQPQEEKEEEERASRTSSTTASQSSGQGVPAVLSPPGVQAQPKRKSHQLSEQEKQERALKMSQVLEKILRRQANEQAQQTSDSTSAQGAIPIAAGCAETTDSGTSIQRVSDAGTLLPGHDPGESDASVPSSQLTQPSLAPPRESANARPTRGRPGAAAAATSSVGTAGRNQGELASSETENDVTKLHQLDQSAAGRNKSQGRRPGVSGGTSLLAPLVHQHLEAPPAPTRVPGTSPDMRRLQGSASNHLGGLPSAPHSRASIGSAARGGLEVPAPPLRPTSGRRPRTGDKGVGSTAVTLGGSHSTSALPQLNARDGVTSKRRVSGVGSSSQGVEHGQGAGTSEFPAVGGCGPRRAQSASQPQLQLGRVVLGEGLNVRKRP